MTVPPVTAPVTRSRRTGWTVLLFAALLAIYWISPVRTAFDSRWSVQTAMSLARGHGGSLLAYMPVLKSNDFYAVDDRSGQPRNTYPIGVSVLAVPAVLIAAAVDPGFEPRLATQVPAKFEHVYASLIGAVAAALFFRLLLAQFGSLATALAGTVALALGTTMWSDATRGLWQHAPMVMFLVIAMMLLQAARRRPDLAAYVGLPLAAAYVVRPTAAIPIAIVSAYVLLRHRPQFIRYVLWACVVGLPWLAFNRIETGEFLSPYYLDAAGDPTRPPHFPFERLLGSLFSPGRGLLVYSPFVLLVPAGIVFSLRDPSERGLMIAYALVIAGFIALIGHWPAWWGGHAYGPRLLTDIVPFLAFFAAFVFDRARLAAARPAIGLCTALVLLGIAMNAPGALSFKPWLWNVDPVNIDDHYDRVWDWRDPPFLRPFARLSQ